jgi:hypothetical protein
MDLTNIFMGRYEQKENQLTYCFLSLLEHLEPAKAAALLEWGGLTFAEPHGVTVDAMYGGAAGNPDGSVCLNTSTGTFLVFLEVKSTVRLPETDQISRHVRDRVGASGGKALLLLAAFPEDERCLAELPNEQAQRVRFATWRQVAERCTRLVSDEPDSKDGFLLEQFADYLKREPYSEADTMMQRDEIEAIALINELRLREKEAAFERKTWALLTTLKDDLCPLFEQIRNPTIKQERPTWIFVTCDVRGANRCWVQFGVRLTDDRNFPFHEKDQPEFGVWISIELSARIGLEDDQQLRSASKDLQASGFTVNIPAPKGTRWLLCSWFQPVRHFLDQEIQREKLSSAVKERLEILLDSGFFRRTIELMA